MNTIEHSNLEQGRLSVIAVQTARNRSAVAENIEAPHKEYQQSIENYMGQIREIRLVRQPGSLRWRKNPELSLSNIGIKIAFATAALLLGKLAFDNIQSLITGDQMAIPTLLLVIGSTICATQTFRKVS